MGGTRSPRDIRPSRQPVERVDALGEHTAGAGAGVDAELEPCGVDRRLAGGKLVVFPKVTDERNWATRAMLGEELWITRRLKDAATVLSAVTSAAAVIAIVAARRHRLVPAAAATAVQMALTLVYWEQMVRYLDRHG
jgi:hypothetical protein